MIPFLEILLADARGALTLGRQQFGVGCRPDLDGGAAIAVL